MFRTALRILEASVGVEATVAGLLPRLPFPLEVKSLLTDFHKVEEVGTTGHEDGRILLEESPGEEPAWEFSSGLVRFRGPLLSLQASASDPRYTLWGNQGFLYRYALYLLESRHDVYSLHACGLWQEDKNRLYVVAGGAGSGKTVFLLSGIERGLKLFSTETVHFAFRGEKPTWFMGSLVDNIRLGTLDVDFPRFKTGRTAGRGEASWRGKVAVDLSRHKASREILSDPETIVLFPRVETGWPGHTRTELADPRPAAKLIFDNISQKISETVVLFDRLALPGMDNPELAARRLEAAARLVAQAGFRGVSEVVTSPTECWAGLLEDP